MGIGIGTRIGTWSWIGGDMKRIRSEIGIKIKIKIKTKSRTKSGTKSGATEGGVGLGCLTPRVGKLQYKMRSSFNREPGASLVATRPVDRLPEKRK